MNALVSLPSHSTRISLPSQFQCHVFTVLDLFPIALVLASRVRCFIFDENTIQMRYKWDLINIQLNYIKRCGHLLGYLIMVWNALDFHLPAIVFSSSENPLLYAVVSVPILNGSDLYSLFIQLNYSFRNWSLPFVNINSPTLGKAHKAKLYTVENILDLLIFNKYYIIHPQLYKEYVSWMGSYYRLFL